MFELNFRITNRIIKSIADIAGARELILNASLLPKWEVKLRKDAIVKMAHHSTSIEGNPLTLEQVKYLLAGKEISTWDKDKREKRTNLLERKTKEDFKVFTNKFWNNYQGISEYV